MIILLSGRHAGRVLRHLRDANGLTRPQLARLVNTTYRTIEDREMGGNNIPTDPLIETARALGYVLALVPAPLPPQDGPPGFDTLQLSR